MSFAARRDELERIMEQEEQWLELWTHPQLGLSEYPDYERNDCNGVVVGMSGSGK